MKKITVILYLLSLHVFVGLSQTHGIAYTAVGKGVATTFLTDYHSLGVNSSALGWGSGFEDKNFTFGTIEFSFGVGSPMLDKAGVKRTFRGIRDQIKGDGEEIDWKEKLNVVGDYAEAGITVNASYNWFGGAYQNEKFGGIAISINEHYDWFSQLNKETTDIIFRGKFADLFDSLTIAVNGDTTTIENTGHLSEDTINSALFGIANNPILISEITKGSKINFTWNRHYNIGYGRKIVGFGEDDQFVLYGGIGARYIQSMAMFDMESDEDGLRANVALSPFFQVDFGNAAQSTQKGFLPKTIGHGYGLDFSASAILFKKIRLAVAINNIGSVTYKTDVYRVRDTLMSFYAEDGLDETAITSSINELSSVNGLLNLDGQKKMVVKNPANFRFGGSISLWENRINVGVDVVAPFNRNNPGSIQNAVFSVGGDIRPLKWLQFNIGYFGGGVYAHNMPVGINFIFGKGAYEIGISSGDAISFFHKNGHRLSAAFGICRFRF